MKLSIPDPRPGSISRAALIASARESGRRVVGVTAPAGYGKSTLLAEWAAVETRTVEWLSLARSDDDPATLMTLLASAHARVTPGSGDLVAAVSGSGISILSRAAPRLASAFASSPAPFVLMIDDLHELQTPACHDALEVVFSGIPQGSQVVAASRFEQHHLPRLRASGDGLGIGPKDLALDATGAERIFADAGLHISRELASSLIERTEGWAAGLYLASLVARDTGHASAISGDDRYVADYLYRESLRKLPEETQRFLRRTAILDQLCAPLCDAVLGGSGAQARLESLEASSLFLIPLDRRRDWYRYHALYREFLLTELRRVEPDVATELHVRAADWYEAHGSPVTAVEHLLKSNEKGRAIDAVATLSIPTYQSGQLSTVARWYAELGESVTQREPALAPQYGWLLALTGQATELERLADSIDTAPLDGASEGAGVSFTAAWAMVRSVMCAGGPEQAMNDASFAMAEVPAEDPWRDTALWAYAEAHLLIGDSDGAADLFGEASSLAAARSNSDLHTLSESVLAILAMDAGRWSEAAPRLERALAVIDSNHMDDYSMSVLTFAGLARLALHRGDRREAERQLARAMRARPTLTWALPALAVRPRLQLARVYASIADRTSARHLLREIENIMLRRPALGALAQEVADFRHAFASSVDPGQPGTAPLTPAELRLLPYLQTHLTLREISERLFVSRSTVGTEVGAIYRKLGVSKRSAAVERATEIGLLGI